MLNNSEYFAAYIATLLFVILLVSAPYFMSKSITKESWGKLIVFKNKEDRPPTARVSLGYKIKDIELSSLFKRIYIALILFHIASAIPAIKPFVLTGAPINIESLIVPMLATVLSLAFYIDANIKERKDKKSLKDIETALGIKTPLNFNSIMSLPSSAINKLTL